MANFSNHRALNRAHRRPIMLPFGEFLIDQRTLA